MLDVRSAEKFMMGAMVRSGWGRAATVAAVVVLAGFGALLGSSASASDAAPITLPDLRIYVPTNLISIGVDSSTGHRQLRFTHVTADVGKGPFEIDPHYDSRTGVSTFTQRIYRMRQPGVWVADHSAPLAVIGTWEPPSDYRFPLTRFTLNSVNGNGSLGALVAVSPKVDYCITGDTQVQGVPNTPDQTAIPVADCTDPTKPLGWSVGWGDQYDQTDSGQPIDLKAVPDGTYVLRAIVDPDHVIHERTAANDVTDTRLRIAGSQVTVLSQHVFKLPLPAARLVAPSPGTSVWGSVSLRAAVAAPSPATVRSVQFLFDGQPIGSVLHRRPYSLPWSVRGTAPGRHYFSVRVVNSGGITATALPVAVTVTRGPGVTLRSLRWHSGRLTLVLAHRPAGRDLEAVIGTASGQRTVPIPGYRLSINSARPTSFTIEVLDDSHHVVASIPVPLNAVPTVRVVNPAAGQTVFGITAVSAQAADRVGVRSVTFFLDGRKLGPAVTHAPYALKWDTRKVQKGQHVLSAKAINALGHQASTRLTVTVRNPAPPMTCFVLQHHLTAHGDGRATTPAFRTAVAGETLLAFVSADGPPPEGQRAIVSGGGQRWKLVSRANRSPGDAEVWQAMATKAARVGPVTATLSDGGYNVDLEVIAMEGADGTAATGAASGSSGAPQVGLTTESATSLVFAVGHDWASATARKLPAGWVMLDQWLDQGAGDTSWTQYTNQPTGPAGRRVTVSAPAPTSTAWNLAAVELINDGD